MRRAMAARSLLAAVLLLYIDQATNAPVTDDAASQALQLAESATDGRGCYYNFERYDEGDRILTNEPCLNCTCHNKMLMCYLRVCPFTKAIGQDCTVEKKADQCCPVITCPQVHVALLTSSTTSESPTTSTALGGRDSYGCILEDNAFYPDGAQVPSDLKKPCELCYCIRNQTACVMQQCTLNVEGCKPVYQEGVCCPVRYDCDYDEVSTTPKPVGLVTTPGGSSDCIHNGVTYYDGAMVRKDEKAPCEHCYCMRGDIVCAVPQCGTPLEGRDCTPLPPTNGQCCPNYQCANGTQEPVLTSTEKLPEASVQVENQGSGETSNESDNSSEESQEVSTEPPKSNDNNDEDESHYQQPQSTETPELTSSSQNPQAQQITELPQQSESESIKTEEQVSPVEDSHSEASQHSQSEAQAPNDVKDVQGTNEIPSLTPEQPATETTTEGPAIEAARIPGEGSCLVEGKTYAHNTIVPTENPCQEICRCFSSIVRCNPRDCPPAPSPEENCMPVTTPGSCCPTYMCDQKTSDAPEVQDHKIDNIHDEGNSYNQDNIHSTLPPAFEEPPATEVPAIFGIPPDSHIQGTNEQVETTGSVDEVSNVPHSESETQEKEETSPHHTLDTHHSINDNSHLDSNLVHSHDASLHGGQVENSDSQENENIHHPLMDISTTAPFVDKTTIKSEGEEESITHRPDDSISQTDKIISNEDILKPQTDSPVDHHEEEVYEPESQNGTTEPSEAEMHNKYPTTEESINENNGLIHDTSKPEDQNSAEQNLENTFEHVTHKDTNVPSEESYNKETVTTDPPAKDDSPSENVEQQGSVSEANKESNQSHLETTSDESIETTSHQDEYHVTESHITESHEPQHLAEIPSETTVLPSSIEDNITDSDEHHEPPHKEEHILTEIHEEPTQTEVSEAHIPTENSVLHSSSETQNQDEDKTVSVTTLPTVDTHASSDQVTEQVLVNSFDHSPEVDKETQEISNPPGFPSVYQPEETQSHPTTEKPSEDEKSEVTTVPAPSKTEENDSIPESSENIEKIPTKDTEKIESEENNEHSPSESQELSNNEATSPSIINTADNTQPAISSEDVHVETEQTGPVETNNKEEEKQSVNDKEFENQGIASSDSIPKDEESPAPVEHNGSSDGSLDTAKDDLPTIIYEEVTVTGMPSIESHVTEGTLDHSVSHQESSHSVQTTTQSHQENVEIHTPGPVGIDITSSTGNQESTPIKEENINQNEEKPSQENSESEIHPTISPDIINEINEEKESLNKISSDNTAQLIEDINQIIQNEVNNQLYSNGQQTHQSEEDPHKSSIENESETDKKNEENEQGTTATPFVEKPYSEGAGESIPTVEESIPTVEESIPTVEESIATVEEHGDNVINEETVVTENIPDKEPVQTLEEHQELGEDITATQLVTTPPTTDPPSITSSHVDFSNQKPAYENEHHSETDDTSQNQSSTELYNMDNGNEASHQQHESYHTTTETNENASNILGESVDQNKDGINGISTEAVLQESPEKEVVQGSVTESHEEISSSIPQGQSVENENQNVISGEVTHIVNSDSEVPDSANQVLVASGDGEAVPTTEQSIHKPEGGELDIPDEENPGSITEEIHQEGNIVHNEENTISEENHRPITESEQEEVSSQEGVSEEGVPPLHESGQVSQEDGTMTHETPTVHQGDGTMTHETPTVHQGDDTMTHETPTVHQEETVPDHPTETNYVAVTELSPVQTESNQSNSDGSQHVEDSEKQEAVSEHQETIPNDNKQILDNQEPISENQPTTAEHHDGESVTQSLEHHEGVPVTQSPEYHEGVPVTQSPEYHEGVPVTQSPEHHEVVPVTQLPEHHEVVPVTQSPEYHEGESVTQSSEHHESEPVTQSSEHHEGEPVTLSSEHHEGESVTLSSEHHEVEPITQSPEHHEGVPVTQSPEHHEGESVTQSSEHHEGEPITQSPEHHEGVPITQTTEELDSDLATQTHDHHIIDPAIQTSEHHDNQLANLTTEHDSELSTETLGHHDSEAAATTPGHHESEAAPTTPEHHESESATQTPEHHENEQATQTPDHHENEQATQTPEHHDSEPSTQTTEHHDSEPSTQTTEHHDSEPVSQDTSSQVFENNEDDKAASTGIPIIESSSEPIHLEEHVSTEGVETQKHETPGEHDVAGEGNSVPTPATHETNVSENVPTSSTEPEQKPVEVQQPDFSQDIVHSTETASISEILSSTQKPIEEPSPMFPTWSQKPLEQHTTPEPHPPEENAYPSGFDPEYEDEEGASYAPGTCRYGGKVYLSAQQIPRDDPCDFCFCFRSDIICLQQSCPPPIRGCYQETIKGFCCPRYECHVSMATMMNITTTTTTTTTTVPPLFFSHAYSGSAMKAGCQVKGVAYHVGERIPSTSGPCLECRCGANGQMKCDPTVCGPQEALLRQVMDAAVSRRRR